MSFIRKSGWKRKLESDEKKRRDEGAVQSSHKIKKFFAPQQQSTPGEGPVSPTPIETTNETVSLPHSSVQDANNLSEDDSEFSSGTFPPKQTNLLTHEIIAPSTSTPTDSTLMQNLAGGQDDVNLPAPSSPVPTSPVPTSPVPCFMNSDPGLWPEKFSTSEQDYWVVKGPDACRNIDADFTQTRHKHGTETRTRGLTKDKFFVNKVNGEKVMREWMIFSPSKNCVYCFACLLFCDNQGKTVFSKSCGFSNWRKLEKIGEHENNPSHREALFRLSARASTRGRIDEAIVKQFESEREYWKNVLRRAVSAIIYLCERGLAFRGTTEKFGSRNNGNYLGLLELIAEYDEFLRKHIEKHGNKGSGHTSYLSKTTADELVHLMARKVISTICEEIQRAKYFSVSVDSTPDISHVDQLTIVLRYVSPKHHEAVERFLGFVELESHTGEALANILLAFLQKIDVNIQNCRGQSYDNAANMSGRYKGMQTVIREHIKDARADYVPCVGHSSSLGGQSGVAINDEGCAFFRLLQDVYNFFAASTSRWKLLTCALPAKAPVPKRLSTTRWSARADAVHALRVSYDEIRKCLAAFSKDRQHPPDARDEADRMTKRLEKLETGIMCVTWNRILSRFKTCNKALQDPSIDLGTAVELLSSLEETILSLRDDFYNIEAEAKELTQNVEYKSKRVRRRKSFFDEDEIADTSPLGFRIDTFLPILDHISAQLKFRTEAYESLQKRFALIAPSRKDAAPSEVRACCSTLHEAYPKDLDSDFADEFVQFFDLITKHFPEKRSPHERYKVLKENHLDSSFPNVETTLRIYLTLMVSNCTGERSFSKLKILKNDHRSTIEQQHLSDLAVLNIEWAIMRQIDFEELVNDFADAKIRRRI
jgi:hypothetical protein